MTGKMYGSDGVTPGLVSVTGNMYRSDDMV